MSIIESFEILYSYIDFEYSLSLISSMLLKYVTRYSRKSLRVLGSVGEPINPSAWRCVDLLPTVNNLCRHNYKGHMSVLLPFRWFYNIVGDSRCPISDTWWQTETGGFMVWSLQYTPLVKFDIFFLGPQNNCDCQCFMNCCVCFL